MSQPETHSNASLTGRFIVELPGERRSGLTVEETALLLETPEGREAVVYRVHRVGADGRMELIGISERALRRRICIVYYRREVRAARQDYDRIIEQSERLPPPCRIVARLLREPSPPSASLVALEFPEVCADAVNQWLAAMDHTLGDSSEARPTVLNDFNAEHLQVVKYATLEPSRIGG